MRGIDAPLPPRSSAVPLAYQSLLQKPRTNAVAPELLEALAAVRRQFPHATLRALAQYLYDENIYRAHTKTGQKGLVSTSVVDVWLKKAKQAGLL